MDCTLSRRLHIQLENIKAVLQVNTISSHMLKCMQRIMQELTFWDYIIQNKRANVFLYKKSRNYIIITWLIFYIRTLILRNPILSNKLRSSKVRGDECFSSYFCLWSRSRYKVSKTTSHQAVTLSLSGLFTRCNIIGHISRSKNYG